MMSHRKARPRRAHLLCSCLVASLALAGCRGTKSESGKEQDATPAEPPSADAGEATAGADQPQAKIERASDLLPDSTLVWIQLDKVAEGLKLLDELDELDKLDKLDALDKGDKADDGGGFAQARERFEGYLGVDMTKPEAWAKVGLDVESPVGLAIPDADGALLLTARVSDAKLFHKLLTRVAMLDGEERKVETRTVDGAQIHKVGIDIDVVERGGHAVFVFQDAGAATDYTMPLATVEADKSLSKVEAFAWAEAQRRDNDELQVYVASPWAKGGAVQGLGVLGLSEKLLGGFGGAALGVDLSDGRVDARLKLKMDTDAPLVRLVAGTGEDSVLRTALDKPVAMLVDGRLDWGAAVELFGSALALDDKTLEEFSAMALKEIGVDPIKTVVPALDGRVAIALTEREPSSFEARLNNQTNLGLHVELGLADESAIEQALTSIAGSEVGAKVLRAGERGDGGIVELKPWSGLRLAVVERRLLLTSDPGVIERVASGTPGAQAEALASPEHLLTAISGEPAALRMAQRWTWLHAMTQTSYYEPSDLEDIVVSTNDHPTLSLEDAQKLKYSAAFKAKRKELEQAMADFEVERRKTDEARFAQQQATFERMGSSALSVAAASDGLELRMLWQTGADAHPLAVFVWALMTPVDSQMVDPIVESVQKVDTLRSELVDIRRATLDAHVAKQGG